MSEFLTVEEEARRSLNHSLIILKDYTATAEGKRHHAKKIQDMFAALTAENERLKSALKDIRDNYDHEEQTHDHQPFKYGGHCRVCTAAAALPSSRETP